MCGRTCLTLDASSIAYACKYNGEPSRSNITNQELSDESLTVKMESKFSTPEWRSEFNCGRKYTPSYNIAPTDITPVLVAADHFENDGSEDGHSRVLVPMMWGMIPFWHKGDYRRHGLTTNNCRLENLMESKLYKGPFQRGQRCVILCEGFYEWQTTKSAKSSERAAYLVYMPQIKGVDIYDKSTWSERNVNLLKMAGIFDVWEDDNGDKIYSYSIITFESSKIMSWLHHRMPAILETEKAVEDWLDYKSVLPEGALSLLRPASELKWHQVSKIVNNSRNKSDDCNKPIYISTEKKSLSTSKKAIFKWLKIEDRLEGSITKPDEDKSCKRTNEISERNSNKGNESQPKRHKNS